MIFSQLNLAPSSAPADSMVISNVTKEIERLESMSGKELLHTITNWGIELGKDILIALAIYFIGRWVIRRIDKLLCKVFARRNMEISVATFLRSLIRTTFYILLIVAIIGVLGINTTSFVALFASAGVAIGMAMSGTLQNFAGGVMILVQKPYRIGDYIQAQGQEGTVKEIRLFSTTINTLDNKLIIIPNGGMSTGIINNFSAESTRRVDWKISISYGDDYDTARDAIDKILAADRRILSEPARFIALKELADNSVDIVARAWVKSEDYWGVFFDVNEKVYKTLPKCGLSFPFPQLDVHINNNQIDNNQAH